MSVIGGYFELELNDNKYVYHDKAIALNTGRNAFEYILLHSNFRKIYIPYYTCDVILQPLERLKIEFEFYHLDKNFLPKIKSIRNDEVVLYVNYFGIMNDKVSKVKLSYKNVIVDNSQAFYANPIDNCPTFYSPRKFFGLPDGGFAYVNKVRNIEFEQDKSLERLSHLIQRIENGAESGYELFLSDNARLNNNPVLKMSLLTQKLLRNINFEKVKKIRNENFNLIHQALNSTNELTPILDNEFINGPMVYPYLCKSNAGLRKILINKKIFVATYWLNVKDWLVGEDCFETYLQDNLIPIPIDQRYGFHDMEEIICEIIKK